MIVSSHLGFSLSGFLTGLVPALPLEELRNIRNYTQEELGKITNISVQSIRRYEQGRLNEEPSAYNLLQLAKALDVTPEYLLIGDNNMTSYTEAIKRELKQLKVLYNNCLPQSVYLPLSAPVYMTSAAFGL